MSSPYVTWAMRRRAADVRATGVYIGAFEFVVWSETSGNQVKLLVGNTETDLRAVFAPGLGPVPSDSVENIVIGCRIGEGGSLLTAACEDTGGYSVQCNHYVIGERVREQPSGLVHAPAGTEESVHISAARAGLAVHVTQSLGDCGIDAMCYWADLPRRPASFKQMRYEIAAFIDSVSEDTCWQDVFACCQELNPVADPPKPSGWSKPAPSAAAELEHSALDPGVSLAQSPDALPPLPPPGPPPPAPPPLLLPPPPPQPSGTSSELARETFFEALAKLESSKLAEVSADYHTLMQYRDEWRAAHPRLHKGVGPVSRPVAASKLAYRYAVGLDYLSWASASSAADGPLRLAAYSHAKWKHGKLVPKKVKVWLARCIKLAQTFKHSTPPSGKRKGFVPFSQRIRRSAMQGRPIKSPMLSEFMWDWFVDIRTSVAARIHPRLVLAKARSVASAMLAEMRKTNQFVELPVIDKHWLARWKRRYGVCLRKPNRRYKCSKAKLMMRLKAMWLVNFRVRALSLECLKRDLTIVGFDQKPLHFNEQGSKGASTLHFEGCPEVVLKENHSATRERFSLMTSVTSSEADAAAAGGPPMEVLFRGTERVLRGLEVPAGVNVRLAFGPKGSYRLEHVLQFLNWALAEWSMERQESSDYRLVYLDAYSAHLAAEIRDFAWARGYVVLYHWGCTTGICQVNDTDLHQALEREYIYCESVSFMHQQLMDPGNITRTRQQVLEDITSVWSSLDHQQGVSGHLRCGLSNNLDGSQDHLLTREAGAFWQELNMSGVRPREVDDIRARVRAGELTWSRESIATIFALPEDGDRGAQEHEGMELDGELSEGGALWDDEDEVISNDSGTRVASAPSAPPLEDLRAVVLHEDTPAEIAAAEAFAARQHALEALATSAVAAKAQPVQWYVERELQKMRKAQRGAGQPSAVLQRFLTKRRDDEHRRMVDLRDESRKKRVCAQKTKALARKMKLRKLVAAKAAKAKREALALLPKDFGADDLGQGKKGGGTRAHLNARIAMLERLRLRSPPLPPDLEAVWPDFVSRYARYVGDTQQAAVGKWLIDRAKLIMDGLGDHLLGHDGKPQPPSGPEPLGQANLFAKWVRRKWEGLPKSALTVSV